MSAKILITGAAGYVGGSLVADFIARNNTLIKKESIIATVRSKEQVDALSKLGITVLQLDLDDEAAVLESVVHHQIRIVVHTASSLKSSLALNLINALSKLREVSGEETYFIHTSGLGAFVGNAGWPREETKDTGPVFEIEKQLADSSPLRKTDVEVIETAKAKGVTSFIVIPSTVYGQGTGEWNKLSVIVPLYISACISDRSVHNFPENTKISGVHISDLTTLYGQLIEKILLKEPIPSGEKGYYFALAHDLHWWELLGHLAEALKARGIVKNSEIETWPSDAVAAESLGVPEPFVLLLWKSGDNIKAENARAIGWKPEWDYDRFLKNIDVEVQSVVDLGKAKSSLVASLFEAVRG